jgi:hypothetical protein
MEILLDFIHIYIIRKKNLSDIQSVTDIELRHFKIKKNIHQTHWPNTEQ